MRPISQGEARSCIDIRETTAAVALDRFSPILIGLVAWWQGRVRPSRSIILHGKHYLCGISNTREVLVLSSPEAEYFALVRGSSRVLGCWAIIRSFGCNLTGMICTDSSGAKSIASRRGAGKIRRIETQTLWLQGVVARAKLLPRKFPGKENPADIGIACSQGRRSFSMNRSSTTMSGPFPGFDNPLCSLIALCCHVL